MSLARVQFVLGAALLVWSGIEPADRLIWFLETLPLIVGAGAVALRWREWPWTQLAVWMMFIAAIILCVGGHWTYAEVPYGEWMREQLGWQRNPWDRVGHFMQGVVTAVIAREMLRRCSGLPPGKAMFWVVVCIAVAVSALYEIVEWWATLIAAPDEGIAFLGAQGDEWDAQWDMTLALAGAIVVQVLLNRLHDRQLGSLPACRVPAGRIVT